MPIPSNQVLHIECSFNGIVSGAGSNSRAMKAVMAFRRTNTVNPLNKANIDAAFQAAICVPMAAALNARFLQVNNSVRFLNDALDAPIFFSHALPGLVAGDSMATTLSAYIIMRTGLRGKSFRGSKKLFPLSEADTTALGDDIMNAAAIARFAAVANALLVGFTDANLNVWVPCVVSRLLSVLRTNPTAVVANDIIQTQLNKRIGSMRHRKVKSVY